MESLSNKVVDMKACDSSTGAACEYCEKIKNAYFKNICERLLLC